MAKRKTTSQNSRRLDHTLRLLMRTVHLLERQHEQLIQILASNRNRAASAEEAVKSHTVSEDKGAPVTIGDKVFGKNGKVY